MLRSALVLLATAFVASASFAAFSTPEQPPAPLFKGKDVLSGKTISSTDFKGKTVVVEWNNFGCPFVQKFYNSGTMQQLQADAVKDGVIWVSVNSSAKGKEGYFADAAAAKAAVAEHHSNASYYLLDPNGLIGHAFGAKATPHMFVIDGKGNLAYQGAIDSKPTPDPADIAGATNYVTEALASLKAGKPIKTSSTQAYGCFVKYK